MKKWLLIGLVVLPIVALMFGGLMAFTHRIALDGNGQKFHLNLLGPSTFKANQPVELKFEISDDRGKIIRDFDVVHEKLLHLIVVRKDRTNFQHVHPSFDKSSGIFTLAGFKFPTNGEYRMFADCTPSGEKVDADGMKMSIVPYKDVSAGDGNYNVQPLGDDKITSDVAGLSTQLSVAGGTSFAALTPMTLSVAINRDGSPVKNLQNYLGALGHMVVLGPNLEYIHTHAEQESDDNQTGVVTFAVTLPEAGQYKIFLQTKANNQVNTTDYTVTANSPQKDKLQDMPGMDMKH